MSKTFLISIIIIVILIVGIAGYFAYTRLFMQGVKPQVSSFNTNAYLPGKTLFVTFASGEWGTFNADHTINLGWGLDYAGPNDKRPSSETGKWSVQNNILKITNPDGSLRESYDFLKTKKISGGPKPDTNFRQTASLKSSSFWARSQRGQSGPNGHES